MSQEWKVEMDAQYLKRKQDQYKICQGKRDPCTYEDQVVDTLMKTCHKDCGVGFYYWNEVWNILCF